VDLAVDRILARRQVAGRRTLTGPALVAAVALHLMIGALAVVGPKLWGEEPKRPEIRRVKLMPAAALGTPKPQPRAQKPPEPRPEPPAPKPEVEPEPKPEPKPEVKPAEPPPKPAKPAPDAKPQPKPARPQPKPEPAQPQAAPPAAGVEERRGSPRGSPLGTSTLGAAVAGIDNPAFTYDYYLDRMLGLIEAQWLRPPVDQPIEAVVHFRIGHDGRISELEVIQESGLAAFDLAALRAVQNAAPFPPLPASYRSDSLGVNLIVR
jgi:TonB family protein